jgi:hypothetical protein
MLSLPPSFHPFLLGTSWCEFVLLMNPDVTKSHGTFFMFWRIARIVRCLRYFRFFKHMEALNVMNRTIGRTSASASRVISGSSSDSVFGSGLSRLWGRPGLGPGPSTSNTSCSLDFETGKRPGAVSHHSPSESRRWSVQYHRHS